MNWKTIPIWNDPHLPEKDGCRQLKSSQHATAAPYVFRLPAFSQGFSVCPSLSFQCKAPDSASSSVNIFPEFIPEYPLRHFGGPGKDELAEQC
jgi:hypothetical protein